MGSNQPSNDQLWFTESVLPFSTEDVRIGIRYTDKLYERQSDFGLVEVFDTPFHGRMLTLDGIIQVAENDEFIYHEMMIALPAIKHGSPKSILIIGGGDGGAAKQALKIKGVERVVMVEIDRTVIDVCEEFIPSIAGGALTDPRVELIIADGMKYVEESEEKFDIIALDLTDPIEDGPAVGLYEEPFYKNVKARLNSGGVVSSHCSSLVIQPEEAQEMIPRLEGIFDEVALHTAVVPTYQLTSFGFLIARDSPRALDKEIISESYNILLQPPKYLSEDMYWASTCIPPYLADRINKS